MWDTWCPVCDHVWTGRPRAFPGWWGCPGCLWLTRAPSGDCAPTCLAAGMQTGRNLVSNTPDCCFVRVPKVRKGIQFHPVKWIRQNRATELPYCASKAAVDEVTHGRGRSHSPALCIPCLYLSSASLAPNPYSANLMDSPCWTRAQELRCWSHPPWTPHELQMARSLSVW